MRTLDRRETTRRPRPTKRPLFDRLETRLALSTGASPEFSVISAAFSTSMTPSQSLSSTLSVRGIDLASGAITVTFDRPVDPSSIGIDFDIQSVGSDGSLTPIEKLGNGLSEALGADGRSIVITTAQPLAPGEYTLILSGFANISGLDGALTSGTDQPLETFSVLPPGIGLADATDLGSPAGTTLTAASSLQLVTAPSDVKLYRVELPATRSLWRLGVEVDAARIGSPLLSALALFDAQGHPIKTSQTGRPDYSTDPYLFAGLAPGTYYIGISGAGNIPGHGGYDPTTKTSGSARPGLASGGFTLHIAADPAVTPTQVKTFFLNYADPSNPTPTGLTLQFTGAIDESVLRTHSGQAISLVDASGKVWSAHAIGYNEAKASINFVFDQPLPEGTYSIKLAGHSRLVNLAGQAPVSAGYPNGTLAMFPVGPPRAASSPFDFGPIPLNEALAGIGRSVQVAANQTVTYRLVITVPGAYNIDSSYTGDLKGLVATINGEPTTVNLGASVVRSHNIVQLPTGVITLTATLTFVAQLPSTLFDQLLDNGVGQTSALSLRLISPTSLSAGAAPTSSDGYGPGVGAIGLIAPETTYSNPTPAPSPSLGEASNVATSIVSTVATVNYLLTTANPVGHPSFQNEAISVVGPVAPGGLSPLASVGIPQGLSVGYGETSRTPRSLTAGEIDELIPVAARETVDQAVTLAAGEIDAIPAPNADPSSAPILLGRGETLVDRAIATLARLVPASPPAASAAESALLEAASLDRLDPGSSHASDTGAEPVEAAGFSDSLGVGFLAVAGATLQHKLGQWIDRRRARLVARRPSIHRTKTA
jgi:hypothetical protein